MSRAAGPVDASFRARLPARVRRQPVPAGRTRADTPRPGRAVHRRRCRPRGRDHAAAGGPRHARAARTARLARPRARAGDGRARRRCTARADWASWRGLERDEAARAADRLIDAGLLERGTPLRFRHPLLRSAVAVEPHPVGVRGHPPQSGRSAAGARGAARASRGAPARDARGRGRRDDAQILRDAARRTVARGAPGAAVRLYLRLLEEPLDADERAGGMLALGEPSTSPVNGHRSNEHLEAAHRTAATRRARPGAALLLQASSAPARAGRTLAEEIQPTIEQLGSRDREVALRLRAYGILIRDRAPTDKEIEPFGAARRRYARARPSCSGICSFGASAPARGGGEWRSSPSARRARSTRWSRTAPPPRRSRGWSSGCAGATGSTSPSACSIGRSRSPAGAGRRRLRQRTRAARRGARAPRNAAEAEADARAAVAVELEGGWGFAAWPEPRCSRSLVAQGRHPKRRRTLAGGNRRRDVLPTLPPMLALMLTRARVWAALGDHAGASPSSRRRVRRRAQVGRRVAELDR